MNDKKQLNVNRGKDPPRIVSGTNSGSSGPPILSAVPPLLRDVGKLAAGVAAVSTGSATGNPRNKFALQPGHSLMDWIRLTQQDQNLTGLGPLAGTLSVSKRQLAMHNSLDDVWIAIRGKVYNVTAYIPFHPGGPDELMRGAGKDATQLFNEVHAWVNYESMLQKCLIGRLVEKEIEVDSNTLFHDSSSSTLMESKSNAQCSSTCTGVQKLQKNCPRFDWIQTTDCITLFFYTTAYENPEVRVTPPSRENELEISFVYSGTLFLNKIKLSKSVYWPCRITVNCDTGKVEISFRKILSVTWSTYGTIKQSFEPPPPDPELIKHDYVVLNKVNVNYNTLIIGVQRTDGVKEIVPISKHVNVFGMYDGTEICRAYTPIPPFYLRCLDKEQHEAVGDICIMIKNVSEGKLSPYICSRQKGDKLTISQTWGVFDLKILQHKQMFLMIAAGTGITPMLGMMLFLLERRQEKCEFIYLLFFNRKEEDILVRDQLDLLQKEDRRFRLQYILSEPDESWTGTEGRIDKQILQSVIDEMRKGNHCIEEILPCACGPPLFTDLAKSLLINLGYTESNLYIF